MRSLVVYSTRTGNTKMIAEAIFEIMPVGAVLADVKDAPNPKEFDLVCLGFWVDKGKPDATMTAYMNDVKGKHVGLFGTLGAWPDSDHARDCVTHANGLMAENTVHDTFMCMGKVDPKLLEAMAKMRDIEKVHPMTEERKARIEEAKKHPNVEDCANAQNCFTTIIKIAREALCVA